MALEAAGHGDLTAADDLHELGDNFKGGALHLLLKLTLVLLLNK